MATGEALAIRDHGAVQHAVLRTTLGGLGAGLLHQLVPGPLGGGAALFLVSLCAVPPRDRGSLASAACLALGVAGALVLPGPLGLAAACALAGISLARGVDGAGRKLAAAGIGVIAAAAAALVFVGLRQNLLPDVPEALAWLAAGGGAGFVAGLGTVGRELDVLPALSAPAAAASRLLAPAGELGELLERANVAARDVSLGLAREAPEAVTAARALRDRVEGYARRWQAIEVLVDPRDRSAMCARMQSMSARARAAVDEEVRTEYLRAEGVHRQQLDTLDGIEAQKARGLARLHHHVAVLEQLRLAALRRRSADTGLDALELGPLVEAIDLASHDLDGAAEALAALPA